MSLVGGLGAVLFFVSLAYFLYSYAVTFDVPAPNGGAAAAITWNVALFTAFALHHSIFAREPVRRLVARTFPPPHERSVYVWIASLMFIAVCALWRPVPGLAWSVEGAWVWALRALQAAGVWLTLRSAVVLDIRDLAGLRRPDHLRQGYGGPPKLHAKAEGLRLPNDGVKTVANDRLDTVAGDLEVSGPYKTTGPYGWVRHPIYSGWFLLVLAATPMTMTRLVFAVVSCAYLLFAIPFEERTLRAAGDGAYGRYMAQVRWRLLPGIY